MNVERIVQQTKEVALERKKQKEQQQQQQLVSLFASDSLSDEATKSYFSQNDTLSEATAAIDINAYILQNQSSSAASSRGLFD